MKRRNFLISATTGVAGLAFLGPGSLYAGDIFSDEREFAVPPLDEGKVVDGKRVFDLNFQKGQMEFFKGLKTDTIGINAPYLGPTLRAKTGDTIKVKVKNSLGYDATLHWHGFELPAKMDGGPHQVITDGNVWQPEFTLTNSASMLWYHSHMLHKTGLQVYKGLAGLFIIEDDKSQTLNLPNDYGVDDIPVVLQDRNFNTDGSFRYVTMMPERMMGIHGNYVLVNGVIAPTFKAKKKLTRFRILNGSNARFYMLGFSDGREFKLVGTDGGLLEKPVKMKRIRLAPAERVDIVVDLSDGKDVVLKSYKGALGKDEGMMGMMSKNMGIDMEFDLMKIRSKTASKSNRSVPNNLVVHPKWNPKDAVAFRDFDLNMKMGPAAMMGDPHNIFLINRKSMDMNRIDAVAKNNSYEIWTIINNSDMTHPFHVHNTQFKVLSINGKTPPPELQGFKDTVISDRNTKTKIMVYFKHFSDDKHPYMFHCHILEHEDGGMMGQFLVT